MFLSMLRASRLTPWILTTLLAAVAAPAELAAQGQPLVRYTFDEITGQPKVAKNTGTLGSSADASCRNVELVSGRSSPSKALRFSGNRDVVWAKSLTALNFGTQDFRTRASIYTRFSSTSAGVLKLVAKVWQGGKGYPGWWLGMDAANGKAVFGMKDGTGSSGNTVQAYSAFSVNDGRWHTVEGGRLGNRIWVSVDSGPLFFAPLPAGFKSVSNGDYFTVGNRAKNVVYYVPGGFRGDIDEAEVYRGGCPVAVATYGRGCPGTKSIVPALSVTGCPVRGGSFSVDVVRGRGGAPGFLIVCLNGSRASIPVLGCTLLVSGPLFTIPFRLSGTPGKAGEGRFSLPISLPLPFALAGLRVNLQAAVIDVGVPGALAATNAVEFTIR